MSRPLRITALIALAVAVWLAAPYVSALALVIDLSGHEIAMRRWLPVRLATVTATDVVVPTRHGDVAARLYTPDGGASTFWIVVPGVHAGGVDEPRLARLTTRLAADGIAVLSFPLPDLRAFRIVGRSTDQIEDAIVWATADPARAASGRVTLAGVSFGGGLALAAAGQPSVADRVEQVISFGGHGLLPRTIQYACTGVLPDGTLQPAHDYGLAVLLLQGLPHLVPSEQVAPLDAAVRAFLDASIVDAYDPAAAEVLFANARALAAPLDEPARTIMAEVNARDATRIGPRLIGLAEIVGGDPRLSPERSPLPRARVFLVHGAHDNVIPQTETLSLDAFYRAHGVRVDSLLTPAVSHADPNAQVAAGDVWDLIRLWTRVRR